MRADRPFHSPHALVYNVIASLPSITAVEKSYAHMTLVLVTYVVVTSWLDKHTLTVSPQCSAAMELLLEHALG